jgi:hypothetical protein
LSAHRARPVRKVPRALKDHQVKRANLAQPVPPARWDHKARLVRRVSPVRRVPSGHRGLPDHLDLRAKRVSKDPPVPRARRAQQVFKVLRVPKE